MSNYLHGVEVLEIENGARTMRALATSVIGIVGTAPFADAAKFPLDTPVLITNPAEAALLTAGVLPATPAADDRGTLPAAFAAIFDQARTPVVVVRVDTNAVEAAQLAEVVGQAVGYQGVYALLTAQSVTKVKPAILIAPGFTHQVPKAGEPAADVANPVVTALKTVAGKLRAIVVTDGPSSTFAEAVSKHEREGGERVYMVEGGVQVLDPLTAEIVTGPASAFAAGVIARTDAAEGFWWSPSNQPINNIQGIGRMIEFSLSDPAAESNRLNEVGIATIVNLDNEFRLWGSRVSEDAFITQRRIADVINGVIERSFSWAMARPQSKQLMTDVVDLTGAYLRDLKNKGAILGGKAWPDPELNTEQAVLKGQRFVNFDFLDAPPLERLTFRGRREPAYFAELVSLTAGQS